MMWQGLRRRCVQAILGVLAFAALVLACPQTALALSSEEAVLARELWHHGMGYVQIAAILGNAAGESGCDPTVDYDLSGQFNWAYEWGCGLFGYTDCGYSPTQLVLMQRTELKAWAAEHGWDWATTEAQVEFTFGDSGGISWRDDWMDGLAANGYYWGYSGVPENMPYDATPDEFMTETRLDVATYSWMACYGRGAAEPNHYASGLNLEDSGRLGEAQRVFDEISGGAYDLYFGEGGNGIPPARPEELQLFEETKEVEVEYTPIVDPPLVSINDPQMPKTPTARYTPKSDPSYDMPNTPAAARRPRRTDIEARRPAPVAPVVLGFVAVVLIAGATYVVAWLQWLYGDGDRVGSVKVPVQPEVVEAEAEAADAVEAEVEDGADAGAEAEAVDAVDAKVEAAGAETEAEAADDAEMETEPETVDVAEATEIESESDGPAETDAAPLEDEAEATDTTEAPQAEDPAH